MNIVKPLIFNINRRNNNIPAKIHDPRVWKHLCHYPQIHPARVWENHARTKKKIVLKI